jgi:hypothetical protein
VTGIFFVHPHTLLDRVAKVLEKVGSENFFKSPDEEVKKAREGYFAYFFTLAMKKYTGRDWWLAQYDQAVRACPDFDFMSFPENPDDMKLEPVELTVVYPHFKSFDEVMQVIEKKQKKYGTKPVKFSLLIFVNHEKSEEWINLLKKEVKNAYPFISIWTIHLRFKNGGKEVDKAVAQRIVPLQGLRIEVDTDDPDTHKRQPLPSYMEIQENGKVTFKTEFIDKIRSFRGVSKC